ncbi:hypothetical protein LZ198_34590 [Myxococcus sp. K15C18031901]|uniref:hypothetical protein n=1 Tax=Myxococcus dinghuensis TaxID=2906761 RepID=UPI0020A782AE|nr:hypothetical protein [Myxococcus dinghuensis]MCP3104015.1 hypothetical protein [Myxococcus dinghuensis]
MKLLPKWCLVALALAGCGGAQLEEGTAPDEVALEETPVSATSNCPPGTIIDCGCGVCLQERVLCPYLPDCPDDPPTIRTRVLPAEGAAR